MKMDEINSVIEGSIEWYSTMWFLTNLSIFEKEHLRRAEIYWKNEPNKDGNEPIVEVLVDGKIEVIEIMKEVNANI